MIKSISKCFFLVVILFNKITMASQSINAYLLKPSGKYGVAFKDIHWINTNLCPDSNFSNKNKNDFSPDNKKYCHELMIRVYYPTTLKTYAGSPYYRPTIIVDQDTLKAIPGIKKEDIDQLAQLKSHTIENAPGARNTKFPVLLFSPGFGTQSQLYENVITELASNGYIVVAINSLFIDGDIALPNQHVVRTIIDIDAKKIIPVIEQDISFVYKKIHDATQDTLFRFMDLKHIGALGHSIGGRAIANVANQHEEWFQALMTLDMGSYKPNDFMMQFNIPYMHVISAYWKSYFDWPLQYHLNKNGYLVTLSSSAKNKHYSYHMNYTDFSTLQYLPAYQASMTYEHARLVIGEDVVIKNHGEKFDELSDMIRPRYLIVKNKNAWDVFYYESGKKTTKINLEMITGLQAALKHLPHTRLTESELIPIKKIIHAYHQHFGNYLGNGDGVQITKALNLYTVDFFNTFLKNERSPFQNCASLTNNTYIKCGPGIF